MANFNFIYSKKKLKLVLTARSWNKVKYAKNQKIGKLNIFEKSLGAIKTKDLKHDISSWFTCRKNLHISGF